MRIAARLLIAALLGAAAPRPSRTTTAAWQAAQRAETAQQALSDRYTAIWSTLDAAQKTRFSAQERAWLNEGRQQEVQACVARATRHESVAHPLRGRGGRTPPGRRSPRRSASASVAAASRPVRPPTST